MTQRALIARSTAAVGDNPADLRRVEGGRSLDDGAKAGGTGEGAAQDHPTRVRPWSRAWMRMCRGRIAPWA